MNWDAVTGLVEMPDVLILKPWGNLQIKLPEKSEIMKNMLLDVKEYYLDFIVKYE